MTMRPVMVKFYPPKLRLHFPTCPYLRIFLLKAVLLVPQASSCPWGVRPSSRRREIWISISCLDNPCHCDRLGDA